MKSLNVIEISENYKSIVMRGDCGRNKNQIMKFKNIQKRAELKTRDVKIT